MDDFIINPGQSKNINCIPKDANGAPGLFDNGSNPAFVWSGSSPLIITQNPSPAPPLVNNQQANVAVNVGAAPGVYIVSVQFGVNGAPVLAQFSVTVPTQPATTAGFVEAV